MYKKICKRCQNELEISNFPKHKKMIDGHLNYCRKCVNKKSQEYFNLNKEAKERKRESANKYYRKNKEKAKIYRHTNIKKIKIKNRKYYEKNKDKINKSNLEYYQENKYALSLKSKEYYQKNKNNIKKKRKNYYEKTKNNEKIKTRKYLYVKKYRKLKPHLNIIRNNIRHIRESLGTKKNNKTWKELGYTPEEFKNHLEKLFKIGMSWDNIGQKENEWNVDHKIPISWFKSNTPLNIVNNLDNLHPIWSKENLLKSNKYSHPISQDYYLICKQYLINDPLGSI